MPKTILGKWSVISCAAMPILLAIGFFAASTIHANTPSGTSILDDIIARPIVALPMLASFAAGITAATTGILAIRNHQEKNKLVYASTAIGIITILFLIAEIIFPH